ncbi:MAG: ATP-binding protein [Clostridiales Family XIII bacterium]|jgi:AAA+ ATPase superfamily predicted ATPase|nr:ATP-binding protein [Clostridiales Family XIII bacterium]
MIGRREEQRILRNAAAKEDAQFVAVYGRRRVGKTWLIRETFEGAFTFAYTGIAGVNAKKQLAEFARALREFGWDGTDVPANWFDAFDTLRSLLARSAEKRRVVFIDELPWMDNKRSDFVPALEHFWNGWGAGEKRLTFIICGSAAAWITKKVFRNRGGLYNRVTQQIALKPFTLGECRAFFDANDIRMNEYDMVVCYMVFGGIPYYLNLLDSRYSLQQNVDRLCFAENAPLQHEYDTVFASLFSHPEKYAEVVEAARRRRQGISREEISAKVGFPDGGNLTRILKELEESGFLRQYAPFGRRRNGALYQLCDPFSAFHLEWMGKGAGSENYWSSGSGSGARRAWQGYAFEQVCLAHVPQIKAALGISGVLTSAGAWRGESAQIDLVLDRNDGIINLCEMKFAEGQFSIDRKYDLALRDKREAFQQKTKTKKALHLTMVTTYGVAQNKYSQVFQSEVQMEDLFV